MSWKKNPKWLIGCGKRWLFTCRLALQAAKQVISPAVCHQRLYPMHPATTTVPTPSGGGGHGPLHHNTLDCGKA